MKIHLFVVTYFCLLITSCHFNDDRILVKNLGNEELLFAVSSLNPREINDILSPFFPVKPSQTKKIYLLRNLDYDRMDVDSLSILQISPEVEDNLMTTPNGRLEYEKIFIDKSYSYLNVSRIDAIKKDKLLITYAPQFKKCE